MFFLEEYMYYMHKQVCLVGEKTPKKENKFQIQLSIYHFNPKYLSSVTNLKFPFFFSIC